MVKDTREVMPSNETKHIKKAVLPFIKGMGTDWGCGSEKIIMDDACIGVDAHDWKNVDLVLDLNKRTPFKDNEFDYLYSSHLIEDFLDIQPLLTEMVRVVKNKGTLVIYMPHADWYPKAGTPEANPAHQRDWYPEQVMGVLREVTNYRTKNCLTIPELRSFLIIVEVLKDG